MFETVQNLPCLCSILLIFQEWQIIFLKEKEWIETQCFKKQFLSELFFLDKLTTISNGEIIFIYY